MARDAIGFEWGNYHRTKKDKKGRTKTPVIYVFYKMSYDNKHSNDPVLYVKVGKTKRHPDTRLVEYKNQNDEQFRMLKYWDVEQKNLTHYEKEILAALEEQYGKPCVGKEVFVADNIDNVLTLIELVLKGGLEKSP